jgi:hypothetical protein
MDGEGKSEVNKFTWLIHLSVDDFVIATTLGLILHLFVEAAI